MVSPGRGYVKRRMDGPLICRRYCTLSGFQNRFNKFKNSFFGFLTLRE